MGFRHSNLITFQLDVGIQIPLYFRKIQAFNPIICQWDLGLSVSGYCETYDLEDICFMTKQPIFFSAVEPSALEVMEFLLKAILSVTPSRCKNYTTLKKYSWIF